MTYINILAKGRDFKKMNGAVAQRIERRTTNPLGMGSNPIRPTI